jgi:hypothetical protein
LLRTPFRAQRFKEGCRVAKAVEAKARDVLASSHHLWTLWAGASTALAERADDESEFVCHALSISESLAEPHCLAHDDILILCRHACVLGLEPSHSGPVPPAVAQKLNEAYRMNVSMSGNNSVNCFVSAPPPSLASRCRVPCVAASVVTSFCGMFVRSVLLAEP